jgi:cytosine/uracil/thiamine/allantoin permease
MPDCDHHHIERMRGSGVSCRISDLESCRHGSGSALTTSGMVGFVVFWLFTALFLVIPVPKMRMLVYTKLVLFVISAIAMLVWTITKAVA